MNHKKQIIGHRGASNLARENTLEAFQKAISLGVDGIELDVRQTGDGALAVLHDAEIEERKVSKVNFLELNQLARQKKFVVPTLEQALNLIVGPLRPRSEASKTLAYIEIKEKGYEQQTAQTALAILKPEQFFIISFDFEILKKIKQEFPQVRTGLLIGIPEWKLEPLSKFVSFRMSMFKHLDLVSLHYKLLGSGALLAIPKTLPLTVWTVDKKPDILNMLNHPRIGGVVTNKPDLALKLRDGLLAK